MNSNTYLMPNISSDYAHLRIKMLIIQNLIRKKRMKKYNNLLLQEQFLVIKAVLNILEITHLKELRLILLPLKMRMMRNKELSNIPQKDQQNIMKVKAPLRGLSKTKRRP